MLREIFDDFAAACAAASASIKCEFGELTLELLEVPPRFVWVPGRKEPWRGNGTTVVARAGTNPAGFGTAAETVHVHCWAENPTQADRMDRAVQTWLRQEMRGANILWLGSAPAAIESTWTNEGYLLVATYAIALERQAVTLADFADDLKPTVTLTKQDEETFDATGATSGDGVLTTGEP